MNKQDLENSKIALYLELDKIMEHFSIVNNSPVHELKTVIQLPEYYIIGLEELRKEVKKLALVNEDLTIYNQYWNFLRVFEFYLDQLINSLNGLPGLKLRIDELKKKIL